MSRTLIASSGSFTTSNCGYSGTVPANEEWCVVREDNVWGAAGKYVIATAGQLSNVTQCHNAGVSIGYCNGQAFHYMRRYLIKDSAAYDCINGACTDSTKYKTPGIYQTLSDCETACGTGCSGKCISNSDWAQIEGLSGQLKKRNCS